MCIESIKHKYRQLINFINKVASKIIGPIVFFILAVGFFRQFGEPSIRPYLINLIILSLSLGTFLMLLFPFLRKFKKNIEEIRIISYFLYSGMYFVFALLLEPFTTDNFGVIKGNYFDSIIDLTGSVIFTLSIVLAVLSFVAGTIEMFKVSSQISGKIEEFEESK